MLWPNAVAANAEPLPVISIFCRLHVISQVGLSFSSLCGVDALTVVIPYWYCNEVQNQASSTAWFVIGVRTLHFRFTFCEVRYECIGVVLVVTDCDCGAYVT